MAFELIEDLHPQLHPLMWLVGNWHGNGRLAGEDGAETHYEQDVMFLHDGRDFLQYVSQTWILDDAGLRSAPGAVESGFLLPKTDGELELLLSTHEGFAQALLGSIDGARMTFVTKWQARPETEQEYTEQRMYGLVNGDLMYAVDRQTPESTMRAHTWGQLKRV